MTSSNISHLSESEQRRLIAVETDVRAAMKEACRFYQAEVNAALEVHKEKRRRLAGQLWNLMTAALLLVTIAGCGFRYEIYSYSPDEFERQDRQVYREQYEQRRAAK